MSVSRSLRLIACTLIVTGCASMPGDPRSGASSTLDPLAPRAATDRSNDSTRAAEFARPIARKFTVYMAPRDLARRTRIPASSGNDEYWLDEGRLIQAGALAAFASLFAQAQPGKERSGDAGATVQGSSGFNPMLGTQTAKITVTFWSDTAASIATLEAKASARGYSEADFRTAVDAAFRDIEAQFSANKALVAAYTRAPSSTAAAADTVAQPPSSASATTRDTPAKAAPIGSTPDVQAPATETQAAASTARPPAAPQPAQESLWSKLTSAFSKALEPTTSPHAGAGSQASASGMPANVTLPINGGLGIYIAADDRARQTLVGNGQSGSWLEEGKLLEEAATRSFGSVFERIALVEADDPRYPKVIIEGATSYNPITATSFAKVDVDFFVANADPVASLTARGSSTDQGEAGFRNAYRAAFRDIESQFLHDAALVSTLANAASASPVLSAQDQAGSTKRIHVPSKGALTVYMSPSDLKKQTLVAVGLGQSGYWVEEGQALQRSALKSFSRIFDRVEAGAPGPGPEAIVTVRGSGTFNPIMQTYTGHVVAVFSAPDGIRIGQFEGRATVDERTDGNAGFEKAYTAALQVIVDQLINVGHL